MPDLTMVDFHVAIPGNRYAVLDRRDEIIDALKLLGIRLSITDCGTDVYLANAGVPTAGEAICQEAEALAAERRAAVLADEYGYYDDRDETGREERRDEHGETADEALRRFAPKYMP